MKTLSNQLTILEQRLGVQFSTESAQRLGYMLGHQSLDQAIYKPLSYIGDRVIGLLHALHTPDARCRNVVDLNNKMFALTLMAFAGDLPWRRSTSPLCVRAG